VLGHVIAEVLYTRHPDLAEDSLTMIRADLVRRETLGDLARGLNLGDFIRLGPGERKSGGRQRISILADTVEAIIGAVSQDGGFEAGRDLILRLYQEALAGVADLNIESVKDPKTTLQELLQGRSLQLPVYEVVATEGSDHERQFTVACRVESQGFVTNGKGSSRRGAEKMAAQMMINRMLTE
jgi:ribonuclease-3